MNRNVPSEWIDIGRVIEFGRAGEHRRKREIAAIAIAIAIVIATWSLSFAAEGDIIAFRCASIRRYSAYWCYV